MSTAVWPQHSTSLAQEAQWETLEEQERCREAWLAYQGQMNQSLIVTRTQQTGYLTDDNITINFARTCVDTSLGYLFGKKITFEPATSPGADSPGEPLRGTESPEGVWLAQTWLHNKQKPTLLKLGLNGAICGHVFLKIIPRGEPGSGIVPRLVVLDPQCVSVRYSVEDIEDILAYKIEFNWVDEENQQMVIRRQVIEREEVDGRIYWVIYNQEARVPLLPSVPYSQMSNQLVFVDITPPAMWPYEWPPIVDCQNMPMSNVFWGMSDLPTDILDLNDKLNGLQSNLNRIIRLHAHPKTWTAGLIKHQLNDLDINVDRIINLPDPSAELHNLEMQSDLSSSLETYKALREAFHEVTQTPEVTTGRMESIGNLSGIALHILYGPLLEKTQRKRATYDVLLSQIARRVLVLGGFEDQEVVVHWPELLPHDPLIERQVAQLDQTFGVSDDTLMLKFGYDPKLERQKIQQQNADELAQQEAVLKLEAQYTAKPTATPTTTPPAK